MKNKTYFPGVTVIICCYNSSDKIVETIKHLALQQHDPNLLWEIILVDNNSIDNTPALALETWKLCNNLSSDKLLITREEKPGLIYARKKGIALAQYEYLVFCDDDNWLSKNYIQEVKDIFTSNTNVGYIGGKSIAVFEKDAIIPSWFEKSKYAYAVGKPFCNSGLQKEVFIWGAGMCVRHSLMSIILTDEFPLLLNGRTENKLLSGEDSEICIRLRLLNYQLYYSDELTLKHYIPTYKLSKEYRTSLSAGFELSGQIMNAYSDFYNFQKLKLTTKLERLTKETYRYIFPDSAHRKNRARRYLYLFSGWNLFSTEADKYVKLFNDYIQRYKISQTTLEQ